MVAHAFTLPPIVLPSTARAPKGEHRAAGSWVTTDGDPARDTESSLGVVIFVGYTIFGATGFGASPITIPSWRISSADLRALLAALLDLSSGLALGFHTHRRADTRELLTLLPFTLVGLTLG